MPKCPVMVGVSTRQNTVNLVPFSQFSGERLLLLETDHAKKQDWSTGVVRVVEGSSKKCQVVPVGNGNDLADMEANLRQHLKDTPVVCWNFGGGQKLQQLALFNYFKLRIAQGCNDWACYAEPQERTTYIITPIGNDRQSLENTRIATDCQLGLQEIFSIFNHKASQNSRCLWQRDDLESGTLYDEHLLSEVEDKWFDDYEKRQKMFRFLMERDRCENGSGGMTLVAEDIFPIKFTPGLKDEKKLGDYFERLMQTRITRIIAADPQRHIVDQVWANVHVHPFTKGNEIAEYDLVLVTNFGTVIPIDAKSYDFVKKDEDARLHNLNKLSGFYTDFWSVFPYYKEDLNDESILNCEIEPKNEGVLRKEKPFATLLGIPFALKERKSSMLVISEPESQPFLVVKKKNRIRLVAQKTGSNKNSVEVNPLENMLETLRLSRNVN